MKKNEIIKISVESLMGQREHLVSEIASVNYNEANYSLKIQELRNSILDIDAAIDRRLSECEYLNTIA